jgi:hypothetical protein
VLLLALDATLVIAMTDMTASFCLLALCINFLSVQACSIRQQHVPCRFRGHIKALLGNFIILCQGTLSAALLALANILILLTRTVYVKLLNCRVPSTESFTACESCIQWVPGEGETDAGLQPTVKSSSAAAVHAA